MLETDIFAVSLASIKCIHMIQLEEIVEVCKITFFSQTKFSGISQKQKSTHQKEHRMMVMHSNLA